MSLVLFAALTFGLCFLIADARVFGCDARLYNDVMDDALRTQTDLVRLRTCGVLRVRQRLLRCKFMRQLMGCYFCMGVWAGPVVHAYMRHVDQHYFFAHGSSVTDWSLGLVGSALLGGVSSYFLDAALTAMSD